MNEEEKIQHSSKLVNGELRYLCNQACLTSRDKLAILTKKRITCKNCLKIILKKEIIEDE